MIKFVNIDISFLVKKNSCILVFWNANLEIVWSRYYTPDKSTPAMLQTSRPPVLVAQQCCFGPKGFGLQSTWKIANTKFHAMKFLSRKNLPFRSTNIPQNSYVLLHKYRLIASYSYHRIIDLFNLLKQEKRYPQISLK